MNLRRVLILLAALSLVGGAAQAATSNIFRFAGASVNPTGDFTTRESESIGLGDGTTMTIVGETTIDPDSAFGFCLDFEHRYSNRFGLGVTFMRSDHDLQARGTGTIRVTDDATGAVLLDTTVTETASASIDMTPLLVGANFHFGNGGKVDVYAGPFLGYVTFGDVVLEGERTTFEDDLAYGGTFGVDIPVGAGKMAISAAARYMFSTIKPDEPDAESLDADPFTLTFGVGYKF
jgi:outer membrane protein W